MTHKIAILFGLTLCPLLAADPAGFVVWPKGVPPADTKQAKFANHALSVSHRDKDGIPELHEKQTDIFVIQSGEGALLVGGEVVGRKSSGPGEIRGTSIKGGVKKNVSAGDVVHIPAGVAHQFFVPAGKQVTYFVVKVDNP
jgi:mannose-6-phosphate isomerase-like protein (cupin superfamily)